MVPRMKLLLPSPNTPLEHLMKHHQLGGIELHVVLQTPDSEGPLRAVRRWRLPPYGTGKITFTHSHPVSSQVKTGGEKIRVIGRIKWPN